MEKEKLVNDKIKCCGCGLCSFKCPKHAITMKEDEYGFIYPYIDKTKCINCGICKKVCQYDKKNNEISYNIKTYAAFSNDSKILNSTASGGIFTSIAKSFIEDNGVVFGCSLIKENNDFIVKHIKVDKIKDLEKLKGSKYVQSDITNIYEEILKELKEGKKVLFSGTPCQVASIKSIVNSSCLYTIDIICHGVPSNKMFNDYINFLNETKNIRIYNYKFRDKKKGWGLYYCYYYYDLKKEKYSYVCEPAFKSSYYQMFLDSYTYRENCYNCPYANDRRVGDITIGDYWGIVIEHPELISSDGIKPEKGVSCIIVNSIKGEYLLNYYNNNFVIYYSDYNKVKKHNHQLNHSSRKPIYSEIFMNKYKDKGYSSIDKCYKVNNYFKNILKEIWYILKKK